MDNREKELDAFFRKNDSSQKHKFSKDPKKAETEKIDAYFNTVASEKAPKKKSFTDKLVDFFKITTFKSKFDEKKVSVNKKQIEVEGRSAWTLFWYKIKVFFINRFSFEAGVDILDETSVLYRKNMVIKNIISVTNIVLFLFILLGSEWNDVSSNIILSLCISLVMFTASLSVKKIIREEPKTLQKQQMGEYISAFYILLMAIAVYVKLKVMLVSETNDAYFTFFSITQAGYALIYFALVVISLYQDTKLLATIFKVSVVLMTIIHLTLLYPLYEFVTFTALWGYLYGPVLTDIVLRTLVLVVFMIALYSTAKITEDMNSKRKTELIKRRAMEKDFKSVVSDVFDVIGVYKRRGVEDEERIASLAAKRVAEIASRLGNYLGYSPKLCKEIFDFSTIHINRKDFLTLNDYTDKEVLDEDDFRKIREKTMIGSVIIKRLQLDQKGEDIVRGHFEKTADQDFIKEMNGIQNNRESQVILLSEIYDILRQDRNYKRGLKHARAIDLLQLEFYPYFDPQILDRFVKYTDDFESLYFKLAQQ